MRRFLMAGSALWAGAVGLAVAPSAQAQVQLEELVVTAQKREQNLQDVPIAVTAFSAETLEKTKADDVRDVALRTPNFSTTEFNVGEPQYTVRGVGSTSDSASSDPSVAVFVDEVYMGRPAISNFDLFDLERIEVLRGPQGTLFGRNTSGGAISVVSARPRIGETSGRLQASVGNFESLELKGVGNFAVSDVAALRLGLSYRRHGAYAHNIQTGADLEDAENLTARVQFLLEPSEDLTVLAALDYVKDDNGGNSRVPWPVRAGTATAPILNALYPPGTDRRRSYSDGSSYQKREAGGGLLRLDYQTSYGVWTSITSLRASDLEWFEDLGGVEPVPPWVLRNDDIARESASQVSQELRLSSPAGARVSWVGGLFYFAEDVDRDERFVVTFLPLPAASGDVSFIQSARNKSFAAFGQVTVPVTERLSVTGGLRYTRDEKDVRQIARNNLAGDPTPGIPLFPGQPYAVSGSDSWGQTTGKLSVEYKTEGGDLFYVTASRGYKSGVFPAQANIAADAGLALPPEKVWSYEAGAKTDFFDRRLRVNAAVFKMDYTDLQQFLLNSGLRLVTFNVDAEIKGAELEVAAVLAPWLTVGGAASALDTNIEATANLGVNLNGAQLPRSPKSAYSLYADAGFEVGGGELSARVDYAWRDDYFQEPTNLPETKIAAYGLLDARVAWAPAGGRWEAALWGKNLTDEAYQTHVIPFLGNGFSLLGPPRTYGLTLSLKLGG